MTALLQTNTNNQHLEFGPFWRNGPGDFSMWIQIRSGPFEASFEFYFEEYVIDKFLKDLEEMDRTLKGSAKLKPLFEDDIEIGFEMGDRGKVTVTGYKRETTDPPQELNWGFVTDQTCLKSLIEDLRKMRQGA